MNLFDQLVDEAIKQNNALSSLRIVVEKELLHHDIIREMSRAGLLEQLTFTGGTCLRACYGSNGLSEDLDFTGGYDFSKSSLNQLVDVLTNQLQAKYGLEANITEPKREIGNVDTWKLKVITRSEQGSMPIQHINIDICSIPSYDKRLSVLRNHYGVDMGTENLILQIESREEIFADKLIAFALRPNRIKSRDLWDIVWLTQQNIKLPVDLVFKKAIDHKKDQSELLQKLQERRKELNTDSSLENTFQQEMRRFLPVDIVKNSIDADKFWEYLKQVVNDACDKITQQNIKQGNIYKL